MSDALFWANGYIIIFISLTKSNMNKKKFSEKNVIWNTDKDNINWSPQNIRLLDIMYIGLINILS